MNQSEQLIERFYTALQRRDFATIAACYHPNVTYSDPVFTDLRGKQVAQMWHMLLKRSKDLEITFGNITADEHSGSARWEARYTFSKTGRLVHNRINSRFGFQDGQIIRQQDDFDLWKWSRMALGQKGVWFGKLPFVQKAIRKEASDRLAAFMARGDV
jgi:ketosteroid isomerase-like protein